MSATTLDVIIAATALTGFFAAYAVVRIKTRPAAVRPGPATPDLGAEPPAVVSMLASGWSAPEEAASATVLDLAARGHLELRQPGNDPRQTTVHPVDPSTSGLLPFERRVLARVCGLARNDVVPVSALTFRDAREASTFNDRLHAEVIAEARRLGLSVPRLSRAVVAALSTGAVAVAATVFWMILHFCLTRMQPPSLITGLVAGGLAGLFVLWPLGRLCAADLGERDTDAGRAVAARWLGVRQWLRAHDTFTSLPPAAVAMWDRYLSYGAALGANRLASTLLDLGMGDPRRVWSGFGGTWHRVRVRYPKLWPHYGRRATELAGPAAKALAIGTVLVVFPWVPREYLPSLLGPGTIKDEWFDLFEVVAVLTGTVLLALGILRLLQVLFDVATRRTLTGEALWIMPWPQTRFGRPCPGRRYLAVDDGSADRTTAWALPPGLTCEVGDTVTIKVRRWTRRVVGLQPGRLDGSDSPAATVGANRATATGQPR